MKTFPLLLAVVLLTVCECNTKNNEAPNTDVDQAAGAEGYVGYVDLTDPLDEGLLTQGQKIFTNQCASCHTIDTVEFAVPALAGVTNRRAPTWIMNMIINVDEMLKRDPVAAELLKKHKMEMPDRNLKVDEARAVLEFLRSNDLEQVGEKDGAVTD